MTVLFRHIFWRLAVIFTIALFAMSLIIWLTQMVRELDLVTTKGQALSQFFVITGLALPFLIVTVLPFALCIALILVLNTMSTDNELVILGAAGGGPMLVLQPILMMAALASGSLAVLTLLVSPAALASLRDEIVRVRVDLVTNIVKPGHFLELERGLTFHLRDRGADNILEDLLVSDARGEDLAFIYQARTGRIAEIAGQTLLIMNDGTIQRQVKATGAVSIVTFQSYAFDLSTMGASATDPVYKPSERSTAELRALNLDDPYVARFESRFRAELHDRFALPLYPFAFALIAYALLGHPRTTRSGRSMAVVTTILAVIGLRAAGFAATSSVAAGDAPPAILYAPPAAAIVAFGWLAAQAHADQRIDQGLDVFQRLSERALARLFSRPTAGRM